MVEGFTVVRRYPFSMLFIVKFLCASLIFSGSSAPSSSFGLSGTFTKQKACSLQFEMEELSFLNFRIERSSDLRYLFLFRGDSLRASSFFFGCSCLRPDGSISARGMGW